MYEQWGLCGNTLSTLCHKPCPREFPTIIPTIPNLPYERVSQLVSQPNFSQCQNWSVAALYPTGPPLAMAPRVSHIASTPWCEITLVSAFKSSVYESTRMKLVEQFIHLLNKYFPSACVMAGTELDAKNTTVSKTNLVPLLTESILSGETENYTSKYSGDSHRHT